MASLLSSEFKTGCKEYFFQIPPVSRCYLWHVQAPTAVECFSVATHAGLTQLPSLNS
jgi:hypothetical protein